MHCGLCDNKGQSVSVNEKGKGIDHREGERERYGNVCVVCRLARRLARQASRQRKLNENMSPTRTARSTKHEASSKTSRLPNRRVSRQGRTDAFPDMKIITKTSIAQRTSLFIYIYLYIYIYIYIYIYY